MSVTTVGASPYPVTPPPRPGPSGDGQAGKSDAHSSSNASDTASRDADTEANRLPPPQAATAPGTEQKVNVIA